jgi:hypothetical protein
MSSDIEIIFRENINLEREFPPQIDESTGVRGHPQLIANIRFSDGDIFTSKLSFLQGTLSESNQRLVTLYYKLISRQKWVAMEGVHGVCTDGAGTW